MPWVILGLGSNLGDREGHLAAAIDALEAHSAVTVTHLSNIYESEPFDVPGPQQNYLNCCLRLETSLSPEDLLAFCQEIEAAQGRVRLEYHGARTLDIDLLLFEGVQQQTAALTLPHPGILSRAFVLVPLGDLFPTGEAPGFPFAKALETVDRTGIWLHQ